MKKKLNSQPKAKGKKILPSIIKQLSQEKLSPPLAKKTIVHNHKHAYDFVGSDLVSDFKNTLSNCSNSANHSVVMATDVVNASMVFSEELLSKISSSASKTLEKNIAISKDLLVCKDATDVLNCQQKMFETNFAGSINFYIDMNSILQNFISKSLENTSCYLDHHVKCFTE